MRSSLVRIALATLGPLVCATLHAEDTLHVRAGFHGVDEALGLVLVHAPAFLEGTLEPGATVALADGRAYTYVEDPELSAPPGAYTVQDSGGATSMLFFTDLPLVHIRTDTVIVPGERRPASFSLYGTEAEWDALPIGLAKRGATSLAYPKNNFRIEFLQDHGSGRTVNVALLGMRSDDDWNLQAMYNEPLRLRSNLTQQLWMDMHTPYYHAIRPDAAAGIAMRYVEVFIDGSYQGLHALSERVDRKQLKVREYAAVPRGAIFQAKHWTPGTLFLDVDPLVLEEDGLWSGFEQKYPDEEDLFGELRELVRFVVETEEGVFRRSYADHFAVGNLVDYFLFLNVLRGLDNRGKNLFLARYDHDTPWFIVPWDLDAVLGLYWDGSLDEAVGGVLTNGLYDRLLLDCGPNGFVALMRARWNELRTSTFTSAGIMAPFREQHARLVANGAYVREELAWPEYIHRPEELDRMERWLERRLAHLDAAFLPYCTPMGAADVVEARLRAWPNPTSGALTVAMPSAGAQQLRLLDLSGRTLRAWQVTGPELQLDLSDLANGEYLLISSNASGARPLRLSIQR